MELLSSNTPSIHFQLNHHGVISYIHWTVISTHMSPPPSFNVAGFLFTLLSWPGLILQVEANHFLKSLSKLEPWILRLTLRDDAMSHFLHTARVTVCTVLIVPYFLLWVYKQPGMFYPHLNCSLDAVSPPYTNLLYIFKAAKSSISLKCTVSH